MTSSSKGGEGLEKMTQDDGVGGGGEGRVGLKMTSLF